MLIGRLHFPIRTAELFSSFIVISGYLIRSISELGTRCGFNSNSVAVAQSFLSARYCETWRVPEQVAMLSSLIWCRRPWKKSSRNGRGWSPSHQCRCCLLLVLKCREALHSSPRSSRERRASGREAALRSPLAREVGLLSGPVWQPGFSLRPS